MLSISYNRKGKLAVGQEGLFYWRGLKRDMGNYVRACGVCQRNKPDFSAPAGLLQPLPILEAIWVITSMDFIEGLPMSRGKDTIFVVVDRNILTSCHWLILLLQQSGSALL